MGNGGDQVLLGQKKGEGPDVWVRSPGFVSDARVNVFRQGDGGPLLLLPLLDPHSKRLWEAQTSGPLSQAGICFSPNEDSRLPSWHPLVHHGAFLEGSNLQGGVPELHHPLPQTPAAQVPLGPSFPTPALLGASKALEKAHWLIGKEGGVGRADLRREVPPSALHQSPQETRAKTSLLLSKADLTRTDTEMTSIYVCVVGGRAATGQQRAGHSLCGWLIL